MSGSRPIGGPSGYEQIRASEELRALNHEQWQLVSQLFSRSEGQLQANAETMRRYSAISESGGESPEEREGPSASSSPSPSSVNPERPIPSETLRRLGLVALSSLAFEDQKNLIQQESLSHGRVIEDLDDYIQVAEGREREARAAAAAQIKTFIENGESSLRLQDISELPPVLGRLRGLEELALLDCTGLQNLEGLRELAALKELYVFGCTRLENVDALGGLAALQGLTLERCPALRNVDALGGLAALQTLNLAHCPGLQNVEGLRGLAALQMLNLRSCTGLQNVDALGGLAALQQLILAHCPGLRNVDALSGLAALQMLNLRSCTGLQNVEGLRGLAALMFIDLPGCTGLQDVEGLQGLAALEYLNLDRCTGLQNVDALRGLAALRRLRLSGCTGLQNVDALSGLAALVELDLSGCTGLQNVDGLRGLAALQRLSLAGCTGLQNLEGLEDRLPQDCEITFPEDLRPAARAPLRISREFMLENPKAMLAEVVQAIQANRQGFSVQFEGEPAIDQGGVRKAFWTDFSRVLLSDDPDRLLNQLPARRDNVNAEKPEGDGWIPQIRADHQEEDEKALSNLGFFIGFGAGQNPALLIAGVLDPLVWSALAQRIRGRPAVEPVLTLLKQPKYLPLVKNPAEWTPAEEEEIKGLASYALMMEEELPHHTPENAEARLAWVRGVQAALVDTYRPTLDMLDQVVAGIEAGRPGLTAQLREQDEALLIERFQGRITPEAFQEALRCSALANNPADAQRAVRMEWFRRWIDSPLEPDQAPANPEEKAALEQKVRRGLLIAITGRGALLEGERVSVIFVENGEQPNCHTCFNQIDLPMLLDSEEEFRKELRQLAGLQGLNAA